MDYITLNLNLLQKEHHPVYKEIMQIRTSEGLGNLTSTYEYMEQMHWLQLIGDQLNQYDHVLLYGLGLTDHLKVLLEHYPDKWFYIYEPDIELFYTAITKQSYKGLLDHPRVKTVAIGHNMEQKRRLIYSICSLAKGGCAFLTLPHDFNQLRVDTYNHFVEEFPSIVDEYKINQNTLALFKDVWLENRLNHLATNLKASSLHSYKETFKDVAAIVVGSGPSLELDIHLIQKLKNRCLVIAAGSSLQALLHHGIAPHFVVIVDGGAVVENIFTHPDSLEVPLIYTPSTNYRATDKVKGVKLYSFEDTDPVTSYFMNHDQNTPVFRTLASVSGVAVQAAIYMGSREIIFAGQDFSFPEDTLYTSGISHISGEAYSYTMNRADVYVESVVGGLNRTTLSYKLLKNNLEEVISWYPTVRFINTSKVGAKILGTEWRTLEQLDIEEGSMEVDGLIIEDNRIPEKRIDEQVSFNIMAVPKKMDMIRQKLKDIKKEIRKLAELSRKNPVKCSKSMAFIEDEWSYVVNDQLFKVLFEPLLPSELQYFDSHLSLIVEEQNIIQKSKYFEVYLGKIVDEITAVIPKIDTYISVAIHRLNEN